MEASGIRIAKGQEDRAGELYNIHYWCSGSLLHDVVHVGFHKERNGYRVRSYGVSVRTCAGVVFLIRVGLLFGFLRK